MLRSPTMGAASDSEPAPRRRKPTRPLRIVAVITPTVAYGVMLGWWVVTEPKMERRLERVADSIEKSSERTATALEKIAERSERTAVACERTERKVDALAERLDKMGAEKGRR